MKCSFFLPILPIIPFDGGVRTVNRMGPAGVLGVYGFNKKCKGWRSRWYIFTNKCTGIDDQITAVASLSKKSDAVLYRT